MKGQATRIQGRRKALILSEDLKAECHSLITMAPPQIKSGDEIIETGIRI